MDIFINGKQGAGKTRAAETLIKNFRPHYGNRLSEADVLYLHDPRDLQSVKLLVEMIRAARVRAVVFDESIATGAHLLTAVQAVKEYRTQINADILAIYVQQAEVVAVRDIADNLPQLLNGTQDVLETPPAGVPPYAAPFDPKVDGCRCPKGYPCSHNCGNRPELEAEDLRKIVIALTKRGKSQRVKAVLAEYNAANASEIAVADYAAAFDNLRDLWEEVATTVWPWPTRATLPVIAKGDRIPVTYDEATKSYTAANLMEGDRILVEAVNVFAFKGALRLGLGHRENVSMLFELAEVVAVSELHVAVDKMNTHYFATGRFEKRAFNAKNCRPATPAEVIEYLNAKLKYQNSK